jgi:hypothetical protein
MLSAIRIPQAVRNGHVGLFEGFGFFPADTLGAIRSFSRLISARDKGLPGNLHGAGAAFPDVFQNGISLTKNSGTLKLHFRGRIAKYMPNKGGRDGHADSGY